MDRRDAIKLGLISGSAFLLSFHGNQAEAAKHPTGGDFDFSPEIKNPFTQELPRMAEKIPLKGIGELLRPENGGVAPNGTVYPQISGNDALTNYRNSEGDETLERIVAPQQYNSGSNVQFPPQLFYFLKVKQEKHYFHSDDPYDKGSTIWGYDGKYPGPTFKSRYGVPILVRIYNGLYDDPNANPTSEDIKVARAPGTVFGHPEITTHLHNGHTGSESDGNPKDVYPPLDPTELVPPKLPYPASIQGLRFRDHHYPMFRAGLAPGTNDGDIAETLSTLWYHDHSENWTAENVYKGLVGFHLFFDDIDSGDENDTHSCTLKLPSGKFDIPLLFQDKRFNSAGELVLDKVNLNAQGFLGDRFVVNGKIQPKMSVERRKYRFRLLNAGPSRFYQFFLYKITKDQPPKIIEPELEFLHIGNDESLFVAPIGSKSIILGVAERGDIVINFRDFAPGDQLLLVNRLKMLDDGSGPEFNPVTNQMTLVDADKGDQVLRFDVVGDGTDPPDPSRVPLKLRDQPALPSYLFNPLKPNELLEPVDLKEFENHKEFEFVQDPNDGTWLINGRRFDADAVREMFQQGPLPEHKGRDGFIWTIKNQGGSDWSHPVHIHMEEFRILWRKKGQAQPERPQPYEDCKKDVLFLGPKEEVQIFLRFRDFLGKYPIHCHNVVHEDKMMMIRYDIVPFKPKPCDPKPNP